MSEESIFKDFVKSYLPDDVESFSVEERKEYAKKCLAEVGDMLAPLWSTETAKIYCQQLWKKHSDILGDISEADISDTDIDDDLDEKISVLRRVNIFQNVSDTLVKLIAENVTVMDLKKDEPFISQYEVSPGLFILDLYARVEVARISTPISIRNGLFGEEVCMPGQHESPVSCYAVEDCSSYFISASELEILMRRAPDLRSLIAEKMINRTIQEQLQVQRQLSHAEELRRITQEILDNIDQGTFSIDQTGEIGESFTAIAAEYLDRKDLAGVPFADIALRHDPKSLRNYYRALHMIFDGNDFDPEVIIGMLPTEVTINDRVFLLNYSFVEDKQGYVMSLFVRMEDLTQQREAEQQERIESEKEEQEREIQDNIRQNVGGFINLLDEVEKTSELIKNLNSDFIDQKKVPEKEYKSEILRVLHGTKGLTSQFKLDALKTTIHMIEGELQQINQETVSDLAENFGLLVKNYFKERDYLISLKDVLGDGIISMLKGISFSQDEFKKLYGAAKQSQWNIAKEIILNKAKAPAVDIVSGWKKDIENLALSLEKKVNFHLECSEGLAIDKEIIKILNSELRHIYRNCLDHGIEMPEVRKNNNKPESGQISVIMSEKSQMLNLVIKDDGAGLNNKKIVEMARKNPNLDQGNVEEIIRSGDIWKILLMQGFSSVTEVTEVSGRGVGMNAVEAVVNELHGGLSIKSVEGSGSQFNIAIPMNPFNR
ncbi:MAG: hypothetical protein GY786_20920 [Proteobacteria bacterium]|nr:hypothetical protein [Pseudomonadota bacterium]